MKTLQIDRRAGQAKTSAMAPLPETQRIVQTGIVLQAQTGTISAIEYLKSRDVGGAVITRVMSGGHLRAEDRAALDHIPYPPMV